MVTLMSICKLLDKPLFMVGGRELRTKFVL